MNNAFLANKTFFTIINNINIKQYKYLIKFVYNNNNNINFN